MSLDVVDEPHCIHEEETMCHIPACHRPNHRRVGSLGEEDGGQCVRLCHVSEVWLGPVVEHWMRESPSAQEESYNGESDVEINWEGLVLKSAEHLSCLKNDHFKSYKRRDLNKHSRKALKAMTPAIEVSRRETSEVNYGITSKEGHPDRCYLHVLAFSDELMDVDITHTSQIRNCKPKHTPP